MSLEEMEEMIKLYGDDLYRFCFHLTNSRVSADDLYQETFIKAVQLRHKLDRSGNVKSYLMGIAANLWKNNLKKTKRRKEILPTVSFEEMQWETASTSNPLNECLEDELKNTLRQVVSNLPEKQRVVVILHYMQDYSANDISKILHIPRGTVLSRLAEARKTIKRKLEGKGYEI